MLINIVTILNNVGKKTLSDAAFIRPEQVVRFFAVHIKPRKFSSPYFSHFTEFPNKILSFRNFITFFREFNSFLEMKNTKDSVEFH